MKKGGFKLNKAVTKEHIYSKMRNNNVPMTIQWEVTMRCNWNCTFCYQDAHIDEVLKTEDFFRVIDELSEMGTLGLIFTGGEALVRKDIFTIAEYAKRKGMFLTLYSNGEKIADMETAKKIARLFSEVEISILAGEPEVHDLLARKPGSWHKTLQGIKNLRELGTKLLIKTPVTKQALPTMKKLEKIIVQDLGLIWNPDVEITQTYDGDVGTSGEHILTVLDAANFFNEFPEYSSLKRTPSNVDKEEVKEVRSDGRSDGLCRAGRLSGFIDAYGNVYPCLSFKIGNGNDKEGESWAGNGPSALCGNIVKQSFKEVWFESEMFRKIRSITANDLTVCTTCAAFNDCTKCMAVNYRTWGEITMSGPETCEKTTSSMILVDPNFESAQKRRIRNLNLNPRAYK